MRDNFCKLARLDNASTRIGKVYTPVKCYNGILFDFLNVVRYAV